MTNEISKALETIDEITLLPEDETVLDITEEGSELASPPSVFRQSDPPEVDSAGNDPAATTSAAGKQNPTDLTTPVLNGADDDTTAVGTMIPGRGHENPVVRKLLQQAVERRAGQELKFLAEHGWESDVVQTEPDPADTDADAARGDAEPQLITIQPAERDSVLRGIASKLVEDGAIQERRAVSIALKARESGVSFLRMLARERMSGDLLAIYRVVSQRTGNELIADKATLFPRIEHAPWLTPHLADRFEILPLNGGDSGCFSFATVDPFDVTVRDWVQRRSGASEVRAVPVLPEVMLDGLGRYRALGADSSDQSAMFVPIDISWADTEDVVDSIEDWEIPIVVDYILHKAHELAASDVHIEPTGDSLVVRNRVDGVLHEELRLPRQMQAPVIARLKVLSNLDVAERRMPQDGRISVSIRDHTIDIRVSTLPTVVGEKVVMRLLDESALRPRPESLGLTDHDLRLLLDRIGAPFGMIMLSGPTGSGKTTTLYSCLSSIDRVARNVVTIEDPVEYRLKGVHQTQVNDAIGMSFANGLRTILRQDPDVIMVGECRDTETAHLAVQASLTGHLVFSTIHSNDAPGVVSRLLDMGVEPFLIANALSLVIAQRLVRVHCEHCLTTMDGAEILAGLRAEGISAAKLDRLGIRIEPDLPYSATTGCSHCRHTGYKGRQAVHELFAMTEELRQEVLSDTFELSRFRTRAREAGMLSMIENAIYLVEEGRTSFSEVIRVLGEN